MEIHEPTGVFLYTVFFSMMASYVIPILQHIKGREAPQLEYLKAGEKDAPIKFTKKSLRERYWYILCCAFIGFFVGTLLSLYWLGYDKTPNIYQQMFWALSLGFLSPQILMHAQKYRIF
jgi:hypothetical protein